MLLANTNCNSYTCTTLKHYGSCDDFSENSERGIRVLASCRIIIFRKAAKQSMTSLQDDINIVCGVALLTKNSKKSGLCKYFKN